MNLVWSQGADADIAKIWSYSLERWGPLTAAKYLDRIADIAEDLAAGRLTGTKENQIRAGFRRQVVASHALWFKVDVDDLIVMRVLHQRRDVWLWVG